MAVPMSPVVENLMPSLVAETVAVSPMLARSRTMRWYSPVSYKHDVEFHLRYQNEVSLTSGWIEIQSRVKITRIEISLA